MPRNLSIEISLDPPVSGWGGFDEWTIEDLESEKIDEILEALEKLVTKFSGYYSGTG